jgi:DNA repair exonuclease SbcCD ATPase subunit
MGILNPRKLILILEDLQEELMRWSTRASEMLETANYTQRLSQEQVDREHHRAGVMIDRAIEDRYAVDDMQAKVNSLLSSCHEAKQQAHKTLKEVNISWNQAQKTHSHWQTELDYALNWLDQAEQRVVEAQAELRAAEIHLSNAKSSLANAIQALQNCRNSGYSYTDSNGYTRHYVPDCSSYEQAVRQAEEKVLHAERRLEAAIKELKAALAELERAKRRVACCQTAVGHTKQAVNLAEHAQERADLAVNAAERSLEHAEAAQRTVLIADEKATEEEDEAHMMMRDVTDAQSFTSEAQSQLRNADRFEESTQRLVVITQSELTRRVDQLYEFNRPDLKGN